MRVEKWSSDKSPVAQGIPAWCQAQQRRLEAAREQLRQIKEAGEPDKAVQGIREVSMQEADSVQGKLEQISQQMMNVVQACNEENGIIEDEFLSVR